MPEKRYAEDLKALFLAGVKQVDPERMLLNQLSLQGDSLIVRLPEYEITCDLSPYKEILLIGAGKASARMAKAAESVFKGRISRGIISVKEGFSEKLEKTRIVEAGHPVPNQKSCQAAEEIIALVKDAGRETLVVNCLSGGGSALLCLPYSDSSVQITLEEKQTVTKKLLECGADIKEINCIRKHLSSIKGGRLAEYIYPASCISFILSDVVGDRLDTIASGITSEDSTTYSDAFNILEGFRLWGGLPESVRRVIERGMSGEIEETPKAGNPALKKMINLLIGTNRAALLGVEKKAKELGYNTVILSSQITGEARETAKFYAGLAMDTAKYQLLAKKPACLIAGGETTVTLKGKGLGGRNQEMALAFLKEMMDKQDEASGICFLSAGTDGNDGPTDAAGAMAYPEIAFRASAEGLSIRQHLENNDSYNFFKAAGGLLITGPTNTNVGDIQIILIN